MRKVPTDFCKFYYDNIIEVKKDGVAFFNMYVLFYSHGIFERKLKIFYIKLFKYHAYRRFEHTLLPLLPKLLNTK